MADVLPNPLTNHARQFEDFLEYLTDALALLSNPTTTTTSDDSTTLAALLQALQTPEQSTSIVVFLRLACSARVRADWEDYAPFLADGFGGGEGGEAGVRRFCEAEVEACGKEADHVQVRPSLPPWPAFSSRAHHARGMLN